MTAIDLRPRGRSPWRHLERAMFARALGIALVLGLALNLANQFEAIFGRAALDPLALGLFFLTPFVVALASQAMAVERAARDLAAGRAPGAERLGATMRGHGIPARALALGLAVGASNAAIVIAAGLIATGRLAMPPWEMVAQAVTLPVLFSLLAQSLTWRRAIRRAGGGAL